MFQRGKKLALTAVLIAIGTPLLITGCGESLPEIKPGEETAFLFSRKANEDLGDKWGKIELRKDGVLVHPGENKPTTAEFHLKKQAKTITIKPFIAELDEAGRNTPEAGVVDVEFIADGKVLEKIRVDRTTNSQRNFNLSGVETFGVRVDKGNGTPGWDWFMISVLALK